MDHYKNVSFFFFRLTIYFRLSGRYELYAIYFDADWNIWVKMGCKWVITKISGWQSLFDFLVDMSYMQFILMQNQISGSKWVANGSLQRFVFLFSNLKIIFRLSGTFEQCKVYFDAGIRVKFSWKWVTIFVSYSSFSGEHLDSFETKS